MTQHSVGERGSHLLQNKRKIYAEGTAGGEARVFFEVN